MKIYLACPYSHPDSDVRQARFEAVNVVAAKLMRAGHIVYSPISHSHPIAEAGGLPLGWDYWERVDREFIAWADAVHVFCLDGWKESRGVQAEIKMAAEMGKPVACWQVFPADIGAA